MGGREGQGGGGAGEGAKAEGGSEAREEVEEGRDRGVVTAAGQDRVETGQDWRGVEVMEGLAMLKGGWAD